jgi:PBSX family phage terminase large subunit
MAFNWGKWSDRAYDSILESVARINVWDGSVRSGKTISSIVRWSEVIRKAPEGVNLLMVGKTYKTLKRNIIDVMIDMFGTDNARYNSGTGMFYFFGREVECIGAVDESSEGRIRGATFYAAYGDEVSLWPESFFKMLLSRLSLPGAKFFGTTNPDSPYHWLKVDYLDREHELSLRRFHFTLEDNPNLDPFYVRELKKEYTGLWFKRFILGLWVLAEGAVYDMWDEEKHGIDFKKLIAEKEAAGLKQIWRQFVACDYGTSNPTTFGLFTYVTKLPAYLTREYYYDSVRAGRQKTDSEYADDMTKWLNGVRPMMIYVDPSAASFIAELRKRKYNVIPANNDVLDGIRFVASLLLNGLFKVDKRCVNSIQEFASYVWDEKAQKRGEDKPIKEHDHCMDMIRYGLFTHFFRAYEQKLYGFNYD